MSEKALILYSDFTGELKKIDIKDGKAIIGEKEFIVDRASPIILKKKRLFSNKIEPFYIFKWDKVEPVHFVQTETEIDDEKYAELKDKYVLKSIEPVFPEKTEDDILPELLRETFDMRFLKQMKKYASGEKGIKFQRWMMIPIAFIISGLVMYLLYYLKILH
jgi:hypothetical protein